MSYVLGLKGPATALDAGDCGGLTALNFAARALNEPLGSPCEAPKSWVRCP